MPIQQLSDKSAPIAGLLLAGGQSTRMNRPDKCLMQLNGKTLLSHAIDRLSPQVDKLILSINGDPTRFSDYKLPKIHDLIEGFAGPLAGIHAGMKWVQENMPDTHYMATLATDTPFFPDNLVYRLREQIPETEEAIILATSNGRKHPVIGLWPVSLADKLETALKNNERKVGLWTEQHSVIKVDFPVETRGNQEFDPFFNINQPEDIEKAKELIKIVP